ncbi:DUF2544 domain-containing protein [Escherichia coli]|nr:DUF2544 domain-containing protein [Escherichia coli]EIV8345741.1 DUF2544 domain-containing protein [Escherichia coli]
MKILRHVLCLLLLLMFNTGGQAATTEIARLYVPAGATSVVTEYVFHLTVATPESVNYGVYKSTFMPNARPTLISWTGGGTPPELLLIDDDNLPKSTCPGLEAYDALSPVMTWGCTELEMAVYYDGDLHGCPWIVSSFVESVSPSDRSWDSSIPPYYGPNKVSSTCGTVSLAPYDVSWNEDFVVRDKVVRLQSTGNVIEQKLSTYLMENGKVCDGSKYDDRGKFCRYVSQQMTFSFTGCDNGKVSVTPQSHPITDKQLHDMILRVDTTDRQPLDATCRFTYILNML